MDKQAVIEREFSEEVDFEVRHILAEFSTVTAMSQDDAVERFKRLWEGQEKGGCPKCLGTGRVHSCKTRDGFRPGESCDTPVCQTAYNESCSDCDGTGENRKVKRRETDALAYTSVYPDGDPAVHMFVVCEDHHAPDRRSGEEHRK